MKTYGENGLKPAPPKHLLWDIIDRHQHATGERPACIRANRRFKTTLLQSLEHYEFHETGMQHFTHRDFEFEGIPVICNLDTPHTTLVASHWR